MSLRVWRLAVLLAAGGSVVLTCAGAGRAGEALGSPGAKWEPWVELGGYAANRPEARRSEAALWLPFAQNGRSLVFGDFRGKLFDDDQREGNAALGYRFMSASGWNPGIWVGFDRRRSELGTDFDQVSFGGELLSADWDLRVNGYVPLNDSVLISSSITGSGGPGGDPTVELIGNQLFLVSIDSGSTTTSLYELAFWGVDAEVGFRVPLERFGHDGQLIAASAKDAPSSLARYHDLRLFAGGYYFDHDDFDGKVFGPKVRAEWRIENILDDWEGSRLTFEASYQYDDVREEQMEAGVRLRIPLGGSTSRADLDSGGHLPLTRQEKRMAEGLKRDTDIVSVSQTQTQTTGGTGARTQEPVEDALSGVPLNTVVYVANGEDLANSLATAGSNVLIIAEGGASTFTGVSVFANQTLLGGGGTLQLRGQNTGALASYTAPGVPAVILQVTEGITAYNNAHIANMFIVGTNIGIKVGAADSSIFVSNSLIHSASTAGIYLNEDNASLTVRNTYFQAVLFGIGAIAASPTIDIRGSAIADSYGGIVIFPSDNVASLTVADTTFSGNFESALIFNRGTTSVTASTGNVDNITSGIRCQRNVSATFTGSIGFTDNTAVTSANCDAP